MHCESRAMQNMLGSLQTGGVPAQRNVCLCFCQVPKLSWTSLRSENIGLGTLPRKMLLLALLSAWNKGGSLLSGICLGSFKMVLET